MDANRLEQSGWGIVFHEDTPPEVRQAMAALHHEALNVVRNAVDSALGPASTVPEISRDAAAQALVAAGFHELNLRDAAAIDIDLTAIANIVAAASSVSFEFLRLVSISASS